MKLYIDMGGTNLRSRLVEWNELKEEERVSSQETGLVEYIEAKLRQNPSIDFIGVSYAGQVNDGTIIAAPNIKVDQHAVAQLIGTRHNVRLEIDNDLNCAVMADAASLGSDQVAALYVGTGLGAAVIDRGRLVKGKENLAFELGHVPYRPAPFICGCGRHNCLELHASGSGIQKWLRFLGSSSASLEELGASDHQHLRLVHEEFELALLHAAGILVTIANPEYLVLGGGVIEANPSLVDMLRARLSDYALSPSMHGVKIVQSTLENAPLEGAKLLEERRYG